VDDVPGAVAAVRATAALDRRACRRAFVERFGIARIASGYLAVYRRLVLGEACPSWVPGPAAPDGRTADPIHHRRGVARASRRRARAREYLTWGNPSPRHPPARPPEGDPHHVLAPSVTADDRTRVLKHGDTFAVFDHLGQIKPGGLGEEGFVS